MTLPPTPDLTSTPLPETPPAATPPPVAPPPPPSPVSFPLGWLLANAAPPIQHRAITEVAALPLESTGPVEGLALGYRPALTLAVQQQLDGTWNGAMLAVPGARAEHFEGVGTIPAVRRLVEYGWSRETPPLLHARRVLFRLLAEDQDPAFLYELAGRGRLTPEQVQHGRGVLREAAGAALAQAGYENDPRLRGAARRMLERIVEFLRSPLAEKPWMRVGNRHVLSPEAAPPSMYSLAMFAHMPLFRTEHHEALDRLYNYLTQPLPRQEPVQLCGDDIVAVPHVVLGDVLPNRNAADADVPFALHWLELMARLNFLRRNEGWCKLFERFLDDRDAEGVWHPHKGMAAVRSSSPYAWHMFPLEEGRTGDERWTDVTFRLGLIARLSGRPIELA